jgi:hypothetical protein
MIIIKLIVDKNPKYIPTKAGAQAGGFGFQKLQARPKAASGQSQGINYISYNVDIQDEKRLGGQR